MHQPQTKSPHSHRVRALCLCKRLYPRRDLEAHTAPDHAERLPLHNEVHARPSAHVDLPALVVTLLF